MGHLMLPCCEFGTQKCQKTEESMNFVVGEHFVTVIASEADWDDDEWNCGEWTAKQASATTPIRVGKHSASSGASAPSS